MKLSVVVHALTAALLLAPLAGVGHAQGFGEPRRGDQPVRQQYALPLARDAQTLAERVVAHIAGGRREETLTDLQQLFEKHATDLLPAEWSPAKGRTSQFPTYPGAALWALLTLQGLEPEWRGRYIERYEPTARRALTTARGRHDREQLAIVMRRWPLCPAAESAAWTLGDLELEAGHLRAALAAWGRAEALAEGAGRVPMIDPESRRSRADQWLLDTDEDLANLSAAGLGGPIPRARSTSWSAQAVDQARIGRVLYRYNSFPVVSGGKLVATNSIDVVALDAASGRLAWHFPGPKEWSRISGGDDLFEGVSHEHILISPAVGGGIAIAALQLPISIDRDDEWQGIEIKTPIPERRLFAFDLETGERLWDHSPKLEWNDGPSRDSRFSWDPWGGTYQERMIVSAPPVIAGSRVLVPCYLKQGRIDFHVACYELTTGALLWRTQLISGQRPRNMFGQVSEEFVSTPITVVGDRAIVQTELGTVASVDLASGQLQWQCQYDQIEIARTSNYSEARRSSVWRETPPVVANGVIVATPSDSRDLLGIDLSDGRVLWSYNEERLGGNVNMLLGADDETVYLAGPSQVIALGKPGGLWSTVRFNRRWSREIDGGSRMPRPLLTSDSIVVPGQTRVVLDRSNGRPLTHLQSAWPDGVQSLGNLWLGEGVLYTLSQKSAHAFFDWDLLLERKRAERRAAPNDPRLVIAEARLHLDRGQALFEADGDLQNALDHLEQAEALFVDLGERDRVTARPDRFALERTRAELFGALGNRPATLRALEAALLLAPTRSDRANVLLALEQLAADAEDQERRALLLAQLDDVADGLALPAWRLEGSRTWFYGEALLDETVFESAFESELPLAAFSLLSRADVEARLGQRKAALEDLHAALFSFGGVELGLDDAGETIYLRAIIEARIARRIELDGRESYAEFEARAEALFDEAHGDTTRLKDLVAKFPHAHTSERARHALVDLAFESEDLTIAVKAVYDSSEIADITSTEGALLLSRLADAVGRRGNREFHAGLRASLALDHPDLRRAEEDVATFTDLAREAALPPLASGPRPSFDERSIPSFSEAGTPWSVGRLVSRTPGEPALHIVLRRAELLAFSEADPAEPAWRLTVSARARAKDVALTEGRVLLATPNYVEAYDIAGRPAWRRELDARRVLNLYAGQGVVIVHASTDRNRNMLLAYEAHEGLPLWSLAIRGRSTWQPAVFGTGIVALYSQPLGSSDRVVVIDLFRGVERGRFGLADDVPAFLEEVSWIHGRSLFVPDFSASRGAESGVSVLDLDTGATGWEVRFPRSEELIGTFHLGERDFLVTDQTEAGARTGRGGVYELDRTHRRAARVIGLDPGSTVLGIDEKERTLLDGPYLFVQQSSRSNHTSIEAWNVESGRRAWATRIPAGEYDLFGSRLPLPAVSESTVALVYKTTQQARSRASVTLEFLDLSTGLLRDRRELRRELRDAERVSLMPVGPTLFLFGHHANPNGGWLEILESPR